MAVLSRLPYPGFLDPVVLSLYFSPQPSCRRCPVSMSRPSFLSVLFRLTFRGCLCKADMSRLSCPSGSVPDVKFPTVLHGTRHGCPSCLSYPSCPVLVVRPCCDFLAPRPLFPTLDVFSICLVPAVLSRLSCPGCPVPAGCPSCPASVLLYCP
jgi:hypothetical protein